MIILQAANLAYVGDMNRSAVPQPHERPLTQGERRLATGMFGGAIDLDRVRIHRRSWFPFQPRDVTMAPRGAIHFHPAGNGYCDCFALEPIGRQGHLIHELTHVWQHQSGINLLLRRHPFCRYDYRLAPGRPFHRYGIEQQAEIVKHAFLLRAGMTLDRAETLADYEAVLPFEKG